MSQLKNPKNEEIRKVTKKEEEELREMVVNAFGDDEVITVEEIKGMVNTLGTLGDDIIVEEIKEITEEELREMVNALGDDEVITVFFGEDDKHKQESMNKDLKRREV